MESRKTTTTTKRNVGIKLLYAIDNENHLKAETHLINTGNNLNYKICKTEKDSTDHTERIKSDFYVSEHKLICNFCKSSKEKCRKALIYKKKIRIAQKNVIQNDSGIITFFLIFFSRLQILPGNYQKHIMQK